MYRGTVDHNHSTSRFLNRVVEAAGKLINSLFAPEGYGMLFWAALAGVIGALATIVFKQGVAGLEWLIAGRSISLIEIAESLPWYLRVGLPVMGGLIAGGLLVLAQRYKGDSPSDYMESIAFSDGRVPG